MAQLKDTFEPFGYPPPAFLGSSLLCGFFFCVLLSLGGYSALHASCMPHFLRLIWPFRNMSRLNMSKRGQPQRCTPTTAEPVGIICILLFGIRIPPRPFAEARPLLPHVRVAGRCQRFSRVHCAGSAILYPGRPRGGPLVVVPPCISFVSTRSCCDRGSTIYG